MTKAKAATAPTRKYGPRVFAPHEPVSLTKQSFRDETNVNNIVARYQSTGTIEHVNQHEARYGYASGLQYREAIELTREGDKMFADLPSSTRNYFNNDTSTFLEWVQDPENAARIDAEGLVTHDNPEGKDPLPGTPKDAPEDVSSPPATTESEAKKQ